MAEASARRVIATGPRRGCGVVRVRGLTAEVDAFVTGRLCAQVEGYNQSVRRDTVVLVAAGDGKREDEPAGPQTPPSRLKLHLLGPRPLPTENCGQISLDVSESKTLNALLSPSTHTSNLSI